MQCEGCAGGKGRISLEEGKSRDPFGEMERAILRGVEKRLRNLRSLIKSQFCACRKQFLLLKLVIVKHPLLFFSLISSSVSHGAVLFSDNFDTSDARLNDASTTGRLSGTASTALESWGAHQNISNGQLSTSGRNGSGQAGARFGAETARYDWAAGDVGQSILDAGGFSVSFDYIASADDSGSSDPHWVGWSVGTLNGDSAINNGDTDYGILFRTSGGIQTFDSGNAIAGISDAFDSSGTNSISIEYAFNSWADGSNVTATSYVDGVQVASDVFEWSGNSGSMHMEFMTNDAGSLVDNLTISTLTAVEVSAIPEPSGVLALGCLFGASMLTRRRS